MQLTKTLNYPTQYERGFTDEEISKVCEMYGVDRNEFSEKLGCVTCAMEDMKILIYHCDVELAIRCCLEKRNQTAEEWD